MQDIESMGGGGSRIFGGGGDRRVRAQHQQALKCPRCDSLNTKFCYYNNYNLSQPRHFCKSCRRYWTRGGVLRNVPVGGGCRKTKRSSKPKPLSPSTTTAPPPEQNSHSSSESSSLTAAAETVNLVKATEPEVSIVQKATTTATSPGLQVEEQPLASDCGIFSEMGNLTSLMTSSNNPLMYDISQFRMNQEQEKMDQTVQADLTSDGGFGSLDWASADQGLFDIPNSVVDHTYWSHNHNLFLP